MITDDQASAPETDVNTKIIKIKVHNLSTYFELSGTYDVCGENFRMNGRYKK